MSVVRRVAAWWTLAHVTKAADLAMKLAAIVAIFAVLSFFKGRGDVYPVANCWAPVDDDIPAKIRLTSSDAKMPTAALEATNRAPALPLGLTSGQSMRLGCSRDIAFAEDLGSQEAIALHAALLLGPGASVARRALTPREQADRISLLRRTYPDALPGVAHQVPTYAVLIAANPDLRLEKVERLLNEIEARRTIMVYVQVTNSGDADALDVGIPPPRGFSLLNTHPSGKVPSFPTELRDLGNTRVQPVVYQSHPRADLEPGETVYFIFESERGGRPPTAEIADIVPTADTTPSVNVDRQLVFFGVLIALVLVPLVVREILSTPVDGKPSSTTESSSQ